MERGIESGFKTNAAEYGQLEPRARSKRDPVQYERMLGVVLWAALFAVLFHFGH